MINARPANAYRSVRQSGYCMLAILCMTAQPVNLSAAEPAKQLIGFNRSQLLISTAKQQCILFDIYIASTHEQRSQGLMFINEMGTYEGMIFLYPQSVQISMWMKNTLIHALTTGLLNVGFY